MKFDADGKCIEIPGQDIIPPGMDVRCFPLIEQHGFLWIWMGRSDLAAPSEIVDVHWNCAPDWPTASGYIHYKANYQLIADNLLDFSHLTFVHRTTLGNSEFPNARPEITPFDRGIKLNRLIKNCEPSPLHAMAGKFEGRVDFWNRQIWWLPSVFENWAGSVPTGGDDAAHERSGGLHLRHFSLLTPETEQSSHYFWIQPCHFPHADVNLIEQVGKGMSTAFAEDRRIIEAQQEVISKSPEAKFKALRNDAALGRIRAMTARLIEQEAADMNACPKAAPAVRNALEADIS